MDEQTIIRPAIFSQDTAIRSAMSTKRGHVDDSSSEINHSRSGGPFPKEEWSRKSFVGFFGITEQELAVPRQTHSGNVRTVERPGEYENCDALITNVPHVAVIVVVADCVPILLYDPVHVAIGAVHAGWRGTVQGIVRNAIEKMHADFKSEPVDIHAFIGPSAGVCCYEVGEEIAVKFNNKIVSCSHSKVFVDLKMENADQLRQGGLEPGNIEISKHCTICEDSLFHSFRREGKNAGRMTAFICLKP